MALFFFIDHASRRLRVSGLVDLVGDQLREELARRYPARSAGADGGDDPATVTADRSGNVIFVDHRG